MVDLSAFLKEQQAGEFDSTGTFTIAADKALTKLAQSQLPDPSYWILKVCQFATLIGTNAMQVSIGARTTRVAMTLPRALAISDLRAGLDSVTPMADPALENLVTGLRAIGGVVDRKFSLRLIGTEATETLLFDGERLSAHREETPSPTTVFLLEVTISVSGAIGQVLGLTAARRAGEASALTAQAYTAPYNLILDGRQIGLPEPFKPKWFTQPLLWNFAPQPHGVAVPNFLRASCDRAAWAYWQICFHYRMEHKILRTTAQPIDYAVPSTLHWLRDGVIVNTERIGGPVGPFAMTLYVDASGCPADLGGLNLRDSPQLTEKRQALREMLPRIVSSTSERLVAMTSLPGRSLSGWDAVFTMTSYIPLSSSLSYDEPAMVANRLSSHPGFRAKLLSSIKTKAQRGALNIDRLEL